MSNLSSSSVITLAFCFGALLHGCTMTGAPRPEFSAEAPWRLASPPVPVDLETRVVKRGEEEKRIVLAVLCEQKDRVDQATFGNEVTMAGSMAVVTVPDRGEDQLRLVGFNSAGERVNFDARAGVSTQEVRLLLQEAEVGEGEIAYLGVEKLSAAAQRARAIKLSEELKRRKGISLPCAKEGERFAFSLPLGQNKSTSVADFKGKVIVMPWFASW